MTNKNDKRILDIRNKIAEKKKELGKSERFAPITNCSLELDGIRHNLHVANQEQLTFLLVKLNGYSLSAKDLGVSIEISGYELQDWIDDVVRKIDLIKHRQKEKELGIMEEKLATLLSEDKRVELELDRIESLLQ